MMPERLWCCGGKLLDDWYSSRLLHGICSAVAGRRGLDGVGGRFGSCCGFAYGTFLDLVLQD